MKKELYKNFKNATDALLSSEFSKDEAMLILYSSGSTVTHSTRGKYAQTSIMLIVAMAENKNLYACIKSAVLYYENHKEEMHDLFCEEDVTA